MVRVPRRELRAVGTEGQLVKPTRAGQDEQLLTGDGVPQPHRAIIAAAGEYGTVGGKGNAVDIIAMALQGAETPHAVLIAASGSGPVALFEFAPTTSSNSQGWLVAFDGFSATAQPSLRP